jgi:hypothetical protein
VCIRTISADSLVCVSATGWQWQEKIGLITADAPSPAAALGHLYAHLIASGFVIAMPGISPLPTMQQMLLPHTPKE